MNVLNEKQLEIMRSSIPGFREKEAITRHVRADEKRYKLNPGYVPPSQLETVKEQDNGKK